MPLTKLNLTNATGSGMLLPLGFRFAPTDREVLQFLEKRLRGEPIVPAVITDFKIYSYEPWELQQNGGAQLFGAAESYFFVAQTLKYTTGQRASRTTPMGYWKATGKDRPIRGEQTEGGKSQVIGYRKSYTYHRGRAPGGEKSSWMMVEYRHVDAMFPAQEQSSATGNPNPLTQSWVAVKVYDRLEDADEEAEGQRGGRSSHGAVTTASGRIGGQVQAERQQGQAVREAHAAAGALAGTARGVEVEVLPSDLGHRFSSGRTAGSSSSSSQVDVKPELPLPAAPLPGVLPPQRTGTSSMGAGLLSQLEQWAMPVMTVKSEVPVTLPSAAAFQEGDSGNQVMSLPQTTSLALSKHQSATSHWEGGVEGLWDYAVDTTPGFQTHSASATGEANALLVSGSDDSLRMGEKYTVAHPASVPALLSGSNPDLLRALSAVGDSHLLAAMASGNLGVPAQADDAGTIEGLMRSGSSSSSGWTATMEDMLREAETRVCVSAVAAAAASGGAPGEGATTDSSCGWSSQLASSLPPSAVSLQQQLLPSSSSSPVTDASVWLPQLTSGMVAVTTQQAAGIANSPSFSIAMQAGQSVSAGLHTSLCETAAVTENVAVPAAAAGAAAVAARTDPTAMAQQHRSAIMPPSVPANAADTQAHQSMSATSEGMGVQASGVASGNPRAVNNVEAAVLVSLILELSRLHRETKAVIEAPLFIDSDAAVGSAAATTSSSTPHRSLLRSATVPAAQTLQRETGNPIIQHSATLAALPALAPSPTNHPAMQHLSFSPPSRDQSASGSVGGTASISSMLPQLRERRGGATISAMIGSGYRRQAGGQSQQQLPLQQQWQSPQQQFSQSSGLSPVQQQHQQGLSKRPRGSVDLPELNAHVEQMLRGADFSYRVQSGGNAANASGLAVPQSPVSEPCLPSPTAMGLKRLCNEDRSFSG